MYWLVSKSTLLKIILGLLPMQKGEIYAEGKLYKGNKTSLKISYVSQKAFAFNAGFPASVKEVVLSGLTKTKKLDWVWLWLIGWIA